MLSIVLGVIGISVLLAGGLLIPVQRHTHAVEGLLDPKVLIVKPRLTQIAYSENSFYSYYTGKCDESCLTQPLDKTDSNQYISGLYGFSQLNNNYSTINDIEIDRNPDLVKEYNTVILLHEEYATEKIFEAIQNHPHVIYLYPNAFYAKVSINYDDKTMTLVSGHGYKGVTNGFDWKHDNTDLETKPCQKNQWNFYPINNGIMFDCYPEIIIKTDSAIRQSVQEHIKSFNNQDI